MIFLPAYRALQRAWLGWMDLHVLSVPVGGLLGGVQVIAVGRWVVARGLSSGQTGAWDSGVGDLGSWCEWGMSLSLWLGQGQSSRHWVSDWWAYRWP